MHLEWGRWFIYLGITWYRLFFVHSALHRRHHHWAELGWYRSLYASDTPVRNGYYTQTTLSKWTSHHLLEGMIKHELSVHAYTQRCINHISDIRMLYPKGPYKIKNFKAGRDLGRNFIQNFITTKLNNLSTGINKMNYQHLSTYSDNRTVFSSP